MGKSKSFLEVREIEIAKLKPFPGNPRKHSDDIDNIVKSIEKFGWTNPVLAQKGTNRVIAGHGRLLAAQKAGLNSVPVIFLDLDDTKAAAYTIADNRLAELSEWDDYKLKELLVSLDTGGFDLSLTGFNDTDLEKLISNGVGSDMVDAKVWDREEMLKQIENVVPCGPGAALAAYVINKPTAARQFQNLCNGYEDGYWISALFNSHRLDVPTKDSMSYSAGFNNPKKRKQFARYMLDMTDTDITPASIVRFCTFGVGNVGYAGEFQPWIARDIYKKFCKAGARVLDPCAGWGGRMMGFHAAQLGGEYFACEPCRQTYVGLTNLEKFLRLSKIPDVKVSLNLTPFEDADIDGQFDFAFTSPPYYDTEKYSSEPTQSYVKYKTYSEWEKGFLSPLILKTMKALKPSAVFLLNVGNNHYDITESIRKIVREHGLFAEITREFLLTHEGSFSARKANEDESKGEQFIIISKGDKNGKR